MLLKGSARVDNRKISLLVRYALTLDHFEWSSTHVFPVFSIPESDLILPTYQSDRV